MVVFEKVFKDLKEFEKHEFITYDTMKKIYFIIILLFICCIISFIIVYIVAIYLVLSIQCFAKWINEGYYYCDEISFRVIKEVFLNDIYKYLKDI